MIVNIYNVLKEPVYWTPTPLLMSSAKLQKKKIGLYCSFYVQAIEINKRFQLSYEFSIKEEK